MNYLNEGKIYYRRRIPHKDESLLMEKESLGEYIVFLEKKVKELETEIKLIKQNRNNNE